MDPLALSTAAALLASTAMPGGMDMLRIDPGTQLCKSITAIEGGQRVLYMEASNEARDIQNETILADALGNSQDYFLKYGRIDLDHATVWQMIRETKLDPNNPYAREIGRPKDVRIKRDANGNSSVWVKAEIYSSKDPKNTFCKAADWFWDTLQVCPPVPWYPSVAGSLLPGGREMKPDGRKVIKALRWHSIGLSRNPVNTEVGQVSTVPLEIFCKALRECSDLSGALSLMAGFNSQGPMPGQAPSVSKDSVQDLQNEALLNPSKADIIRQAIVGADPGMPVEEWLHKLTQAGIAPAEGMAYLLAILDSGHQVTLSGKPTFDLI